MMRCQVRKINHINELNAGELLLIFPVEKNSKKFRSDIFYGVKDVNQHEKYQNLIKRKQPFAFLYVYDLDAARAKNPRLFADTLPLFNREVKHKVNVYKVLTVLTT